MAYALIASTAKGSTDNSNVTTTAINTTGATLLVVECAYEVAGTLSDSKGNTWTGLTEFSNSINSGKLFYCIPTSVGSGHTFSYATATGYPAIAVGAFSGAKSSLPYDVQNNAWTDASATLATGSVTPSEGNELIFTGLSLDNGGGATSINSSFTLGPTVAVGATNVGVAMAYLIQTTAAAVNPTWTTSTPANRVANIATFKAAPAVTLPNGEPVQFPNPTLARPSTDRLGYVRPLNLPIYFYVPPPPFDQSDWPNPVLRRRASQPFDFVNVFSIPLELWVPPYPHNLYDWPNPTRRKNAPAWEQAHTTALDIPLAADYDFGIVWVSVDGTPRAQGRSGAGQIETGTLTISDTINETPSTCTFTARGFTPRVGQTVVITLGSLTLQNPTRIFAGNIIQVQQQYTGGPQNTTYTVSCIDWTWQLSKKVTKQYAGWRANAIAIDLIATYAPAGFTASGCSALDIVDAISFTNTDLMGCLTQLAKRIGGYAYVDYDKGVHLFVEEVAADPVPLTSSHPSLLSFSEHQDISQWITKAYSEGGGSEAAMDIAVGQTTIPVTVGSWYNVAGGTVAVGAQRVTYTGAVIGGGGAIVGPGASPGVSPTLTLADGAGVESGVHLYAYTFTTAAGESIQSPTATITTGSVAAPVTGLTPGTPAIGAGPENGNHDYQVTFVTAVGETTPGTTSAVVTVSSPSAVSEPVDTPSAAQPFNTSPAGDGGLHSGVNYQYQCTFVTALGETIGGPTSSIYIGPTGFYNDGSLGPTFTPTTGGSLTANTTYRYFMSLTYDNGESAVFNAMDHPVAGAQNAMQMTFPAAAEPYYGRAVTGRNMWRQEAVAGSSMVIYLCGTISGNSAGATFTDTMSDATLVTQRSRSNYAAGITDGYITGKVNVVIPVSGDARVTKRKVYRSDAGAAYKLCGTVNDNTSTSYADSATNASLGVTVPSTNDAAGAAYHTVPLTAIPISSAANVTSRKVYRRFNASGTFKLVTTIANNTATTFSDTVPNASLGAAAPSSNTAAANRVSLSAVAIGGTGVTGRKVYRTTAGGSQLKLLATIADNATTTYADSTADASLGANVPTLDTSGLTQPNGQVIAGSTLIPVPGTAPFSSSGGYAIIGNGQQVIQYTGITATSLTGIPATGAGAILATIGYNSTVTECGRLTGIPASGAGSVVYAIAKGEPINLLAIADNAVAQAALAALLGTDGIQESYTQDGRISYAEALSRAEARLAQQPDIAVSIAYMVNSPTSSGRNISVDLPAPTSVTGTYTIQSVTISAFTMNPLLFPTYSATASSTRFSFEDFLRRIQLQQQ